MTTLERISLGKENMYSSIHEAPYHLATSRQRQEWTQTEKPCFNNEILQFWEIYGAPSSDEYTTLPREEALDERRRFIKRPIITLTEKTSSKIKTAGGIWIDSIRVNKYNEKTAHIHIRISEDKRKFAYPFSKRCEKKIRSHIYRMGKKKS